MVVEFAHFVGLDADGRAMPVIGVVAMRHDRVQAVIAAGKFHADQNGLLPVGLGPGAGAEQWRGGQGADGGQTAG